MAGWLMKRAGVLISGFVQAVGFRHFVSRKAEELGLTGWVRNTEDPSTGSGQVEAVFEGEKEKLEEMIEWCNKGPWLAEVDKVDVVWEDETGEFSSFEIK